MLCDIRRKKVGRGNIVYVRRSKEGLRVCFCVFFDESMLLCCAFWKE